MTQKKRITENDARSKSGGIIKRTGNWKIRLSFYTPYILQQAIQGRQNSNDS
ncbi:hypothetical protein PL482_01845 [Bacteroides xylanisolvens]|uniref:hypothetical protein n=1 Tax=Bacteroides xylanisolvens TaxID=371601 RepID=UPI001E48CAE9|nr:hypothetical protein [Bacteroides xylanisolvens]MDB0709796.1 hypothetical protein [Bacteroides xylanisolvens]